MCAFVRMFVQLDDVKKTNFSYGNRAPYRVVLSLSHYHMVIPLHLILFACLFGEES